MRFMKLASIGAVAAGIVAVAPASASSTTNTLNVSATVTGNCKFNSAGPTALTLGNSGGSIDPSVAVDATGSANVAFRCTTGTTSSIAADNGTNFSGGSRNVKDSGTDTMAYSLSLSGA